MRTGRASAVAALVFAAVIAVVFLRCLVYGEAFVPADQLRYVAPWSSQSEPDRRPAWNPLQYDSVGQFYCWSSFAARTLRDGRLPLWNPYQLCGTPFAANSQSAIYYPPNALRPILGAARAAGWLAALHLLIAALGTYWFVRSLGLSHASGIVGGLTYSLSTWQIAWLHLPTFAAASCWLPVMLLAIRSMRRQCGALAIAGLACSLALTLLAGHLQIALYAILCAFLYALWLIPDRDRGQRPARVYLGGLAIAVLLAALMAAPQLVPTAELSARSHRTGKPSLQGYAAYSAYAVHPAALGTLALPDLFGNPSNPEAPYFGFSRGGMYFNYAEGALYVGLLPVLLAAIAVAQIRRRSDARCATFLAAAALSIALATPTAMLLYFGIPGFSQSGSPGRALVLWAFAMAWLAALGAESLLSAPTPLKSVARPLAAIGALLLCAVGIGVSVISRMAGDTLSQTPDAGRQAALLALSVSAIAAICMRPRYRARGGLVLAVVAAVDLLAHNATYNSTSHVKAEIGQPSSVDRIHRIAGHNRIAPINSNWSFAGPTAAFPPNVAMLYGLHDVQGYDSLLPGQYKRWMAGVMGADPSPPEVGNIVFMKAANPAVLDAAGVRVVLSAERLNLPHARESYADAMWLYERIGSPGRARMVYPDGAVEEPRWVADEPNRLKLQVDAGRDGLLRLADQHWPGWKCFVDGRPAPIMRSDGVFRAVSIPGGARDVEFRFEPAVTRLGHYLLAVGLALVCALCGAGTLRRASRP